MSPFQSKFTTYQSISPQAIISANKHIFYAQGVGNLQIKVPNGNALTPVLLKDTLYMPQIGLTVVSIGHIVKAGYSVSFEDNRCQIKKGSCHSPDPYPDHLGFSYNVDYPSYFFED